MCYLNDLASMSGHLIHCLMHLWYSEVQRKSEFFNRRTKSAGHPFMFSTFQWPATFSSSLRGLKLIPILLNLLLINNIRFHPLSLSLSLSLSLFLALSLLFACLQLCSGSSGACRCLEEFTFSPLLFEKGKGGGAGAVVGFLLICGFEPRVAPVPWCWSQYWIWPRSHLRAVG